MKRTGFSGAAVSEHTNEDLVCRWRPHVRAAVWSPQFGPKSWNQPTICITFCIILILYERISDSGGFAVAVSTYCTWWWRKGEATVKSGARIRADTGKSTHTGCMRLWRIEENRGCSCFLLSTALTSKLCNKSALPGQDDSESVHLLTAHHTVMHHMWKTFGSAAVTPTTKKRRRSYRVVQTGCSWVGINCRCISQWAAVGCCRRPAADWCYNHEKAFKKMSLQGQNIQPVMDCS